MLYYLCRTTPKYSQCISLKKTKLEQIESKIDFGLDRLVKKHPSALDLKHLKICFNNKICFRSLNAITGWIKICLSSEQKKSDFKPETDVDTMTSMVRT